MSCVWTLTPALVPGLHKAEEDKTVTVISIQFTRHHYNRFVSTQ